MKKIEHKRKVAVKKKPPDQNDRKNNSGKTKKSKVSMVTDINPDAKDITGEGLEERIEAEINNEKAQFDDGPELDPVEKMKREKCLSIIKCFKNEPPKRKWDIHGLIPSGTIGALIGMGGCGKTNLALSFAISMAAGQDFPPFSIDRPVKVLVINVEDSSHDLWRRMYAFAKNSPDILDRIDRLEDNLMIHAGRGEMGQLMRLSDGNPIPSEHAAVLEGMIAVLKPDLVILDTKSRLYGLNEDSNDHAAQWVRLLESIIQKSGCGIMVLHHVSKSRATDSSQLASRGASSLIDNARYAIGLTPVSEDEAKKYGLSNPEGYFAMQTVKSNYAPPVRRLIFQKMDEGLPKYVKLKDQTQDNIIRELVKCLAVTRKNLTRRELLDRAEGSDIRSHLKQKFRATKVDLQKALESALEQGFLMEVEKRTAETNQKRMEIFVVKNGDDNPEY